MDLAKPAEKPALPRPAELSLGDVSWTVTPEGKFCLDARGYEQLSRNNAEVLRWISEASWQIDYYRGNATDGDHSR